MAARQQLKGTGLKIQYEDLVPKSEWEDKPEATLLTIDLPGFAKEQIKVTYVHSSKMIRVTGERTVADRRWSRFNEVFSVPENCLVDKIHGSFKNNVLTITMPKETITKMGNVLEGSKTVAEKVKELEEKRVLEESRRKEAAEKKKLLEEKEGIIKKLQEEAKAKEKLREASKAKEKLREETMEKEKAEARKLEEEAKSKENPKERKLVEEAKSKENPKERKLVEEATLEKKSVEEYGGKEKIIKPEERKLPEVVYTKSGSGSETKSGSGSRSGSKSGSGGVGEVVKSGKEKLGYLGEKRRGKEIKNEEKKLMVNVGVAALVIFALGAYISYTLCSSSSSSSSAKPE